MSGNGSGHLVLVHPGWIAFFLFVIFFCDKLSNVVRHPRKQKADIVPKTTKEKLPKRMETSTQQKVKVLISFLLEFEFPTDHRCKLLATNNSWNCSANEFYDHL